MIVMVNLTMMLIAVHVQYKCRLQFDDHFVVDGCNDKI